MMLIEPDEIRRFAEVLHACDAAQFELHKVDVTDPCSDELLPIKGLVEICYVDAPLQGIAYRRRAAWVRAFERDLLAGCFA